MSNVIDVTVPDLGDFHDVPVIEVLIAPGETIVKDAPLVTLESEKASMEVPASHAGVVRDVKVHVGDKVSTGSVLASVEVADAATPPASTEPAAPAESVAPAAPGASASAAPAAPDAAPKTATAEAATVELTVPDVGDFRDIPVIDVLVKPGDSIEIDAPLVTLESEKASMDVPASAGGVIREVRVRVGDKVSQGTVLATVATAAPPKSVATAQLAPAQTTATPAPALGAATPATALAEPISSVPPSRDGAPSDRTPQQVVHASPAIRRFARELGVELSGVTGSGPNGRVTRDDVQAFVKRSLARPAAGGAAPTAGLSLPAWPVIDFAKFGPIERAPLSRIRKLSGPNLHRNWVMIPHVTHNEDADVTELEALRKQLNAEQKDAKVTMLAFLMKASVAALRRYPEFNASLDGDELVLKRYYNIGFAADTPGGLIVPVVRDVERKGVLEIARETTELAAKAREGKLGMNEMQGGTFTISSLGGIGGTSFTPIVNAPEVAILGVTRAATRPVWDGATFVPRLILPLSLSYDHRVIDGAAAARFCTYLAGLLRDMRRTLL